MKQVHNLYLVFAVVILSCCPLAAQHSGLPCGASEYNERMRLTNPDAIQQAEDQLRREQQARFDAMEESRSATTTYIVPVVFHIVHDYGEENISDAQILDQMNILNRDFLKLNSDTSVIIPEFSSIAGNARIEFRLATVDPEGNCTNGIDRIPSKRTYNADDGSKLNYWPRDKYLNIWVVRSIGTQGVAGYAYYPSSVVGLGMIFDGIILLHDYIGSIGTGSPGRSRALTHEVGHWLNLPHCWGSTNQPGVSCGDDGIPDTPRTQGWANCPANSSLARICDNTVVENYQNFMEYSYCSVMFTQGQITAMHAALTSSVSDRNKLWRSDNLAETGTATLVTAACPPRADFSANRTMVCQGGTITFYNETWNATGNTFQWEFPGGTPATSTAANPVVTYNTAGMYAVKLIAANPNGTDVVEKFDYIRIGESYALNGSPYVESFENIATWPEDGWTTINYGNDAVTWERVANAGTQGNNALRLRNINNFNNEVDEIVSPSMDLRWLSGMQLSFDVAFATTSFNDDLLTERLRISSSVNCGQSWSVVRTLQATELITAGIVDNEFIPGTNPQLWRTITINLNPSLAQERTIFKFEFIGGEIGNNFYMDNIRVSGNTVSVEENSGAEFGMALMPNPADNQVQLAYSLEQSERVEVEILDVNGRTLCRLEPHLNAPGMQLIDLPVSGLSNGIYMVRLTTANRVAVQKLIIQRN